MSDTEDQRDVELSTLSAIFPEIQKLHDNDPYTFALDVPVNPVHPVTVFFPSATDGKGQSAPQGPADAAAIDSHELAHLPAVRLVFSLPPVYPTHQPPSVTISTTPSWIPLDTVKRLVGDCTRMWEELGRDLVVYPYLDHIQQSAEDVFGLVSNSGGLQILPEHKIAVLDFDIKAKQEAFEKETFDCGVCLDQKLGAKCHRMLDCRHVFCVQCLQDFYNNAIKEGDLATVRCLEPGCAKKREAAPKSGSKRRKVRTFISPGELLQIPLDPEVVQRYVRLKYKTELESDKNTIFCPRPWCEGAARSDKHKKPTGFELHDVQEDSDDEDEQQQVGQNSTAPEKPEGIPTNPHAKLAVCEDCNFAFCSGCDQSWHGQYSTCTRRVVSDLKREEEMSQEFLSQHTTPCPSCGLLASKVSGCNHMYVFLLSFPFLFSRLTWYSRVCFRCRTHFCYLCAAWLDPYSPYQHYNQPPGVPPTPCHMRLWTYEQGTEIGQNGFVRGEPVEPPAEPPAQPAAQGEPPAGPPPADAGVLDVLLAGGFDDADEVRRGDALAWEEILAGGGVGREAGAHHNEEPAAPPPVAPGSDDGRVVVTREGPLVLRLDTGAAPAPRRDRAEPQQAAAPAARQQHQRGGGPHRNRADPGIARQQPQPRQQQQQTGG